MPVSEKILEEKGHAIMKISAAKYAALVFPKIKGLRYPPRFTGQLTVVPLANGINQTSLSILQDNFIICANMVVSILLSSQYGVTFCEDYTLPPKLKPSGLVLLEKLCIPQNIHFKQKDYPLPAPSKKPRLFGVVLDDEAGKNLIVAFRGTQTQTDWKWDTESQPIAVGNSYIAHGFHNAYLGQDSKNPGIVKHLVKKYHDKGYKIWITGHSLGAAVATITSHFLYKAFPNIPFTTITFGSPRSLSPSLAKQVNKEFYRVENEADFIPPSLPAASSMSVYAHAGHPFMYSYNGASSAENHAFYLQEMVKGAFPFVAVSPM